MILGEELGQELQQELHPYFLVCTGARSDLGTSTMLVNMELDSIFARN